MAVLVPYLSISEGFLSCRCFLEYLSYHFVIYLWSVLNHFCYYIVWFWALILEFHYCLYHLVFGEGYFYFSWMLSFLLMLMVLDKELCELTCYLTFLFIITCNHSVVINYFRFILFWSSLNESSSSIVFNCFWFLWSVSPSSASSLLILMILTFCLFSHFIIWCPAYVKQFPTNSACILKKYYPPMPEITVYRTRMKTSGSVSKETGLILVTHILVNEKLLSVHPKTAVGIRNRKKKNGNCKAFCITQKCNKK